MIKKAFDESVEADEEDTNKSSHANNAIKQHQMIQCHYCGLYIPKEEAIHTQEGSFCCKEHAHLQKKD